VRYVIVRRTIGLSSNRGWTETVSGQMARNQTGQPARRDAVRLPVVWPGERAKMDEHRNSRGGNAAMLWWIATAVAWLISAA
jgi:hypothetical protein